MARNTKIQLRRGLAADWLPNTVLAPGEIGFELDTGKFKIGATGLGLTAGSNWDGLPYAGGSALISSTGIGFRFSSLNNAYTLYSYITGISGGQDGITFQTLPLSGLLNDTSVSGTYYTIGLSAKLENFQDSSISISSNTLSSTSSGITVSGYNLSTISLNPDGGIVTASGINIRNITDGITVTSAIGGLSIGESFTTSSGITNILKKMLEVVYEPTVGRVPGVTMGLSGAVSPVGSSSSFTTSGRYEVGTTGNITISSTLDQGYVAGTGLGAGWRSGGDQGVRAGAATAYSRTFNGNTNTVGTSHTVNSYAVVEGPNTASATITHASGITPINSLGANSATTTVLAAGGTVTNSAAFTGVRRLFCSYDTTASAPTTSANIRSLPDVTVTFESGKTFLNYGPGTIFRVEPPAGTRRVIVAVPVGLYSLGNTITVFDETSNSFITTGYPLTTVSVAGANSAAAVTYNVYSFIPDGPFVGSSTHKITLN
jgi:hypothetical protein